MKKITLRQEKPTGCYIFRGHYGKKICLCPDGVWWEFPELEDETEIDLYAVKVEDAGQVEKTGEEWVLLKVYSGWVHILDEDAGDWVCAFFPTTNRNFIEYFGLEMSNGCLVNCRRIGDNPPDLGLVD